MTAIDYFAIVGYSVTAGAGVLLLRYLIRDLKYWRLRRRIYRFLDQWDGE